MESPLLLLERKFDIRIWVLMTNLNSENIDGYIFKEGYIRTSSQKFEIS